VVGGNENDVQFLWRAARRFSRPQPCAYRKCRSLVARVADQQQNGTMRKFHLFMVGVWAALAVPTVLWWKDMILWVAIMSLYANVGAHWSAYQASRAEDEAKS
jgi:hypothetical protein